MPLQKADKTPNDSASPDGLIPSSYNDSRLRERSRRATTTRLEERGRWKKSHLSDDVVAPADKFAIMHEIVRRLQICHFIRSLAI